MKVAFETAVVLGFLVFMWLIARREADWRSNKPKPWNPKMGRLIRVRPEIMPSALASITVGLAGLPLAFTDDFVDVALTGYVLFAGLSFILESRFVYPLWRQPCRCLQAPR